jgi:hypothetical protein
MVLRGCANILGTYAVTDCRCSHKEASFLTTISFVGVLASSNGVSVISAFGTIISVTVKRRHVTASGFRLAWHRNIAEENLRTENESGDEAALIV